MANVSIEDPARMNLLGLILGSIIERNMADEDLSRRYEKLVADVVVRAGEMTVALRFDRGRVVITRRPVDRPRAQVGGSLASLMKLSLGGGMVGPWLAGRLKTKGSLLLLLKIRGLLQARKE